VTVSNVFFLIYSIYAYLPVDNLMSCPISHRFWHYFS